MFIHSLNLGTLIHCPLQLWVLLTEAGHTFLERAKSESHSVHHVFILYEVCVPYNI